MLARLLVGVIRLYQLSFSAMFGRSCRFEPSCSHYAQEALRKHGVFKGLWLAVGRVLRCNPWGGKGYDPVPQVFELTCKCKKRVMG